MKYPIKKEYKDPDGNEYIFEYCNCDSFDHLDQEKITQVYAAAFCGDEFIVVNNITKPGSYTLIGGSVEKGEKPDEALIREIKEESNMKVLDFKPIGYQKVIDKTGAREPFYQLRYFAIVEPYGDFVSDPAGKVTEVIMCNRDNHKKYFDWGEIGDSIIGKAYKLKNNLK